jgi:hypothetical protein
MFELCGLKKKNTHKDKKKVGPLAVSGPVIDEDDEDYSDDSSAQKPQDYENESEFKTSDYSSKIKSKS